MIIRTAATQAEAANDNYYGKQRPINESRSLKDI